MKSGSKILPAGISVVIPVFNSGPFLAGLAGRPENVLRRMDRPFEVLLVNDGSQDESWEKI